MAITYLNKAAKQASTNDEKTHQIVSTMLNEIEHKGEAAALKYSQELDGYSGEVIVTPEHIERAKHLISDQLKEDIEFAYKRVTNFAKAQRNSISEFETEVFPGITKKYQSSYDNSIVRIGVRDDWKRVKKYDYYLGNFRWTGFDYLGESFGWPARTANFGIIDLAGFPKDHYYLYQSLWSDQSMIHILPHWTHPGKEGVEIPVVVYTNCECA